jgi:hypothetical protein
MENPSIKGISRIDSTDTHGWLVRLYAKGNTYSKLFSDTKFDSKEHAFIKAFMFRLNQEDIRRHKRYHSHKQSRNKSGVSGVSISKKKDSNNRIYYHYIATWIDENHKLKTKSFSTKKYGKDEALELAKSYRQEMLNELS